MAFTQVNSENGRSPPASATKARDDSGTDGRSNKEIATELFMGLSTVEAHLSRVYRKLGIRSRASLESRLVKVRVTAL